MDSYLQGIPQERSPREDVVAALRRVDAHAELIYLGDGEWWLGVVRPNALRRMTGEHILAREAAKPVAERSWKTERMGELCRQGFALVKVIPPGSYEGTPGHELVDWFRAADGWLRNTPDEEQERQLLDQPHEFKMQHARAVMRDRLHSDGRYVYNRVARQQVRAGWTRAQEQAHTERSTIQVG